MTASLKINFRDILQDVSKNLTHNEWRTRIACCLAIRDLIRRPTGLRLRTTDPKKKADVADDNKMEVDSCEKDVPEKELKFLWQQLFRVMDDIHEGTREAANGTANILAKVC